MRTSTKKRTQGHIVAICKMASNPWSTSYATVGNLRKVLKVAENNEIYQILQINAANSNIGGDSYGNPKEKNAERSMNSELSQLGRTKSLNQIKLLKEISKLNEQLCEFQDEREKNKALNSTADPTDITSLNSILLKLEDLCVHLQDLINNKDNIVFRLREAYSDHLTVDAEYHRDMSECFQLTAVQLGQLNSSLERTSRISTFSLDDSNLNSTCKNMASMLADEQCYYQAVDECRTLMRTRLRKQR